MMKGSFLLTILLLLGSISTLQWYEKNNPKFVDRQNFKQLIQDDTSSYKMIKFFTRNCKYCRYLKKDVDNLKKEEDWGFKFYEIDCTEDYNLCRSLVEISGFPHVGLFDQNGVLVEQAHGYHPIENLRPWFKSIKAKNNALSSSKPVEIQKQPEVNTITQQKTNKLQQKTKEKQSHENLPATVQTVHNKDTQVIDQVHSKDQTKQPQQADIDENETFLGISLNLIFKIIVVGISLFVGKIFVLPYINKSEEQMNRKRVIQLPYRSGDSEKQSFKNYDAKMNDQF